jgi:hypothetical protein
MVQVISKGRKIAADTARLFSVRPPTVSRLSVSDACQWPSHVRQIALKIVRVDLRIRTVKSGIRAKADFKRLRQQAYMSLRRT